MSLGMMTPMHQRWSEFIKKLHGPGFCDFRGETPETYRFDCDNTATRPLARKLLSSMGATQAEIEQSLGYFSALGGMCDCEIVFNVQNSFDHMMGRTLHTRRTGKNPKKPKTTKEPWP